MHENKENDLLPNQSGASVLVVFDLRAPIRFIFKDRTEDYSKHKAV